MCIKRILLAGFSFMLSTLMLASCEEVPVTEVQPTNETEVATYAFVAKDLQNPYMQKMYEGFEIACKENNIHSIYSGASTVTTQKQAEIVDKLIEKKVAGIAIAANDDAAMQSALEKAMQDGIKVISLDSAVNAVSRQTHIQQADPEQIGRYLVQSAYNIVGGNGGAAILTTTPQATNQNLWIDFMKKELEENAQKYENMPLVKIVYGDDDEVKSRSEVKALLSDDRIKVIIAPTAVGIVAAAQAIEESGSAVKLTGLGLPSKMSKYIENGICPEMYLWNTQDVGYLAGYTLNSLVNSEITGAEGEKFNAGSLGMKTITHAGDGGTEVILGEPLKFDISNIEKWKDND